MLSQEDRPDNTQADQADNTQDQPTTLLSEPLAEDSQLLSEEPPPTTVLSQPEDDLTTDLGVLSGDVVEEITSEREVDYDILIQGSDRTYPAIVIRKKHRGPGATIQTISKNGQYKDLYAAYADIIAAYQARKQGKSRGSSRIEQEDPGPAGSAWADPSFQNVVEGSDNSK